MGFDLNNLNAYTEENRMPLFKKAIMTPKTLEYIGVMPDVKSSAAINIISGDLVGQAGACGWNEDGTTLLTQRTMTVCPLKINEAYCIDDLEAYWTQKQLRPGSYNEDMGGIEGSFAEFKSEKVAELVENLIWNGSTTGGTGNLALCDGFRELLKQEGTYINGNVSGLTFTLATAIDVVDLMVDQLPADLQGSEDIVLFMGLDYFRIYSRALRDANLYNYPSTETGVVSTEMFVPGTGIKVVGLKPLNGTNEMVLAESTAEGRNLWFGTDLLNDFGTLDMFYDKNDDEVRLRVKWKQGVQVAFPDQVVYFK